MGTPITPNSPTSTGGAVTAYSVSPALPAGLSLSASTGIISGTPAAATATASYTVTASNTGGSTTATLTITTAKVVPTRTSDGLCQHCPTCSSQYSDHQSRIS